MDPLSIGIGAGASLLGGIFGNKSQEDMLDESRKLPDWLRPYIKGAGPIPEYLTETPKINTNWLDHILSLGSGNPQSNWAPMTSNSPWFNPDQTFTPQQGGGQFGSLPPGMQQTAPPPAAQQSQPGLTADDMMEAIKQRMRDDYEARSTHGFMNRGY